MEKEQLPLYVDATMDTDTNKSISVMLGQRCEERMAPDMMCADGIPRNLWNLSVEEVAKFIVNRGLGSRFDLYVRSDNGPVKKGEVIPKTEFHFSKIECANNDALEDLRVIVHRKKRERVRHHPGVVPFNVVPPREIYSTRVRKK